MTPEPQSPATLAPVTLGRRSLGKLRRTKLDSGRAVFLGNVERLRSGSLGEDYPTGQYFLARRGTGGGFPMSRDGRINANFWWPVVETGQEGAHDGHLGVGRIQCDRVALFVHP